MLTLRVASHIIALIMLISANEIAKRIGVHRQTLYKWLNDSRSDFPRPYKIGIGPTGYVRWDEDEVKHWIESRRVGTDPAEDKMTA